VGAGFASRLGFTVDRLDDIALALDTAIRQPPASGTLAVTMAETADGLRLEVGPLVAPLVDRASVDRVLSTLVDEIRERRSGPELWIGMYFAHPLPTLAAAAS
jgi:hypothetical protein